MKILIYILFILIFANLCFAENILQKNVEEMCQWLSINSKPNRVFLEKLRKIESSGSTEEQLKQNVMLAITLSHMEDETAVLESITICQYVTSEYPNTWQADLLGFYEILNYGLVKDYRAQIIYCPKVLANIDFERLDQVESILLDTYRTKLNLSGEKIKNLIYLIWGYANTMEANFEKAEEAYQNISDSALREYEIKQLDYARKSKVLKEPSLKESAMVSSTWASDVSDDLLRSQTNAIETVRQNVQEKRELAVQLCDAILNTDIAEADIDVLIAYLTLANPDKLDGTLRSPDEVFPAVAKLIEIGPAVATPLLQSITQIDKNPRQAAINTAYILRKTIGAEKGLSLLYSLEGEDNKTNTVLKQVADILEYEN